MQENIKSSKQKKNYQTVQNIQITKKTSFTVIHQPA